MDVQIDNVSNMPTNYDYINNILNPSIIFEPELKGGKHVTQEGFVIYLAKLYDL